MLRPEWAADSVVAIKTDSFYRASFPMAGDLIFIPLVESLYS
jgi:hypothetical protein